MIPGVNPRQMQHMMRRMGVTQVDIDATEVIIKTKEGNLIFDSPSVAKVNMMGQETYQIVGTPREESFDSSPQINEDDIKTVSEQTGKTRQEAAKAIEEANGDLAAAIMNLSK
jgi:nascent polypeptide-associated complex subunit alpha